MSNLNTSQSQSTKRTLIKNAKVVRSTGIQQQNVLIQAGRIQEFTGSEVEADQVIDAAGLYLLPGIIDDQVHFRQPGLEHKEDFHHATRACAKGG